MYGERFRANCGAEACADFESLLLHGRAALDRLTWLVSSNFGSKTQSFLKLEGVLSNFAHRNDAAARLIVIIENVKPWFSGTFGKINDDESLRDLVAHKHAAIEGTRTRFGLNRVRENAFLLLDCEIKLPGPGTPTPVLSTAHDTVKWLSYVVLNSRSQFLWALKHCSQRRTCLNGRIGPSRCPALSCRSLREPRGAST